MALPLLLQSAVFLRTDLNYVLTNLLRMGNLMQDTRRWTSISRPGSCTQHPRTSWATSRRRELLIVRWYAALVVVGGAVIAQFVLLGPPRRPNPSPAAASATKRTSHEVTFWDSAGPLAVVGLQFGLLGLAVHRECRRRSARAAQAGRAMVAEQPG